MTENIWLKRLRALERNNEKEQLLNPSTRMACIRARKRRNQIEAMQKKYQSKCVH